MFFSCRSQGMCVSNTSWIYLDLWYGSSRETWNVGWALSSSVWVSDLNESLEADFSAAVKGTVYLGNSFRGRGFFNERLAVDSETRSPTSKSIFCLFLLYLTDLLLFDFAMDAFGKDVFFLIFSTKLLTGSLEMAELSNINRSAKENRCFLYDKKNGVCVVAAFVWLLYANSSPGK